MTDKLYKNSLYGKMMSNRTYDSPYIYVIYGMDKIWGIADNYSELDKLCAYLEKSSRKEQLTEFDIVVFDGLTIIGKVPFSRHTDLMYPHSLLFKSDF